MDYKIVDPMNLQHTPIVGEVIKNPKGELMVYTEDKVFVKLNTEHNGSLEMNLYDMNKQLISQLPALTDFSKAIVSVRDLHGKYWNKYYMMYCKEISYFTLFEVCGMNEFGQDVIECCANVGTIKAMDMTEAEDALEIWVETEDGPVCLYLFPYDSGVVRVGE